MDNYNFTNKSGPVSSNEDEHTKAQNIDDDVSFRLGEPAFGTSLSNFSFGGRVTGMESGIHIVDGRLYLLMKTVDSLGFCVHALTSIDSPKFMGLYARCGEGVRKTMRFMEHRLIPLIERFLTKFGDPGAERLILCYFMIYDHYTVNSFKAELCSWEWCDSTYDNQCKFLLDTIQIQSGDVSSRQRARLRRELIQREKAIDRAKEKSRQVPKERRKAQVKKAQAEAFARKNSLSEIDLEGGLTSVLKSIVALPVDIYRTGKRFAEVVQRIHKATETVDETINDEGTRSLAFSVGQKVIEAALTADERSSAVVDAVQGVARAHRNVTEEIQNAIKNLTQSLSRDLPDLIVKTMVACLFVYLFTSFTSTAVRIAVLSLAGMYFSADVYNLFAKAFRLGKGAVQNEVIHEEGFDHTFFIQVLSLVMAGSIFSGGKPPGYGSLLAKIVSAVASFPRLNKGIESLLEVSMDILEKVVNTVRSWMKLHPVRVFKKHAVTVEKLINEAIAFEYELMCGTHGLTDTGIFNRISHFVDSFAHHRKQASHDDKLKKELDYFIVRFSRHAEPYKVAVNANGGYRPQPVTLVLAGDPGIGKTMCTQSLVLTVMKLTGHIGPNVSVEEASRALFVRPANSRYMDGYTNNYALLLDDLFQEKPFPGGEGGEAQDIMTYANSFNASLNMADCPKKGMYPFTSKLILATTNCRNFSQIGLDKILLDMNAFQRRIDFHVIVQVKPQYRLPGSSMLNYELFVHEMLNGPDNINNYPWHMWECVPTTFTDGNVHSFEPGTGQCMKVLISNVAARIRANADAHSMTMNMFEKIVRGSADDWIVEEGGLDPMYNILNDLASSEIEAFPLAAIEEDSEPDESVHEEIENDPIFQEFLEHEAGKPRCKKTIMEAHKVKLLIDLNERRDRVVNLVKKHFNFTWDKTIKVIAFTVGAVICVDLAIGFIKATYEWIRSFFFGPSGDISTQSNGPKVRTVQSFKQDIRFENGVTEVTGLWYHVYKNSFKAFMDFGNGTYQTMGQVLVLKGNSFVMPAHFLKQIKTAMAAGLIKPSSTILFRSCAIQRHNMTITVKQFLGLKWHLEQDKDLAFSSFGDMCPPKKDITKFILSYRQIKDLGGKAVRLDTARATANGTLLEFSERTTYFCEKLEVARTTKYIGDYPNGTNHKDWLSYVGQSQPGDCGAILSVTDFSALQNKFVCGLHIGRRDNTNECYATQLDIETVNRALERLGVPDVVPEVPIEQVAEECGWSAVGATAEPIDAMPFTDGVSECFGSFIPVCTVTPGIVSPQQSSLEKTQLGREKFFEDDIKRISGVDEVPELEVMKLHSHLGTDGKVILPMAEALKPFAGDTKYVDPDEFKTAVFAAMHPLSIATRRNTGRKLTFEEAVLGCPEIGLASIPRSTSLGYPWCTKKRDKTYFFGKGEEYDLSRPEAQELKKQVLDLEQILLSGKRPLFLCRDFLKDEVRKKGKGARLIAGTDVRYYILCRMYFGAFTAATMSTHQETGVCLGVNQYAEWGWLRKHITKHGDRVWDGDFEKFDSRQQPQMLWAIFAYIANWYTLRGGTAEDNDVRKILFMDLVNSRHLVSLKGPATGVVEWVRSLPSGHFLTAVVNTIYDMSCIAGGFIKLTGHLDVWNYISIAAQGDDNLVGAGDAITDVFNQVTLAKVLFQEYGMVYTAGRKGEELKPYMAIDEVTFLQRRFLKKDGVDVCPIRPESFLHSLYYTKKNKEEHVKRSDMVIGLERALEELAMHEEVHWGPTSKRIVEALNHYGSSPALDVSDSRAYLRAVLSRVPEYI